MNKDNENKLGMSVVLPWGMKAFLVCFPESPRNLDFSLRYMFCKKEFLPGNRGELREVDLGETVLRCFNPNSTNPHHHYNFSLDRVELRAEPDRGLFTEHSSKLPLPNQGAWHRCSVTHFQLDARLMAGVMIWEDPKVLQPDQRMQMRRLAGLADGIFSTWNDPSVYVSIECSSGVHQGLFERFFQKVRFSVVPRGSVVDLIITDDCTSEMFSRAKKIACFACAPRQPQQSVIVLDHENDRCIAQLFGLLGELMAKT